MVLQFTGAFNLETNDICKYDYLTMTDGDGTTLMGKTCGTSLPPNLASVSNSVNLLFKTDSTNSRQGWSVSWSAVRAGVSFPKKENKVGLSNRKH